MAAARPRTAVATTTSSSACAASAAAAGSRDAVRSGAPIPPAAASPMPERASRAAPLRNAAAHTPTGCSRKRTSPVSAAAVMTRWNDSSACGWASWPLPVAVALPLARQRVRVRHSGEQGA